MTANELQRIAAILSNSGWCRYWLNYWGGRGHVVTMAIQVRDERGKPQGIAGYEQHGFREGPDYIYTVERTNEDGTPYISKMT